MKFPHRARLSLACGLLAAAGSTGSFAAETPTPGRYAGQFCVATAAAQPSCGSAEVELRRGGALRVRISDIVYRLQLHSSQVDVTLLHGAMQIDEFTADYTWAGSALQFADNDKKARYELRLEARQAAK